MSGLKMFIRIIFTIAVICALASSCEKVIFLPPPPLDTTKYISFDTIIKPIFSKQGCINCHYTGRQDPDLSVDPYNALVPKYIKLSDSLNAEASEFYQWITTNSDHIPRTTTTEKASIKLWISQGVRNN
jgi:hypothetical protein